MDEGRLDEDLRRLLDGLRTSLPGVQVLFAFLFMIPFQARFVELSVFERRVYLLALLSTAVASVLLIAPSNQQRLRWLLGARYRDGTRQIRVGSWMGVAGTAALAVGVAAAVTLVTLVVFSATTTAVAVGALVGLMAWVWFVMPLAPLRAGTRRDPGEVGSTAAPQTAFPQPRPARSTRHADPSEPALKD